MAYPSRSRCKSFRCLPPCFLFLALSLSCLSAQSLFVERRPEDTKVLFENPLIERHPRASLYYSGAAAGGSAIGDVDGNGLPDLFLVSGPRPNRLFVQTEPWKFEVSPATATVHGGDAWGTGTAFADIDNDGDLDLYVCNHDAPNNLYINEDGEFRDKAAQAGVDVKDASMMAAFADYDNDGHLDMFLLCNRLYRDGGRPALPPFEQIDGRPRVREEFARYYRVLEQQPGFFSMDEYGRADYLFRNNGDGTFTNVTETAGVGEMGYGLSATWWDYNDDGHIDLYVANDFTDPDRLFRNNGDGTFTDVIAETMPYITWSSMGADFGDFNNDGLLDFLCADMAATSHFKAKTTMGDMAGYRRWVLENGWPRQAMRNMLFINTGTGFFRERAFQSGVAKTDWTWAVKIADYDHDGQLDVFFTNGSSRSFSDSDVPFATSMLIGKSEWDIFKHTEPMREKNRAFRNDGGLRFSDVSDEWGLGKTGISYSASHGDLDGDGDLDLVVVNLEENVSLYENRAQGNALIVGLRGTKSNSYGIGAKVIARAGERSQLRQLSPMTGFNSSNQPVVHFGLGDAEVVDELEVRWPSGMRQILHDVPANKPLLIEEAEDSEEHTSLPEPVEPLYKQTGSALGLDFRHEESVFDDYRVQPLLPGKLSQLGGGVAVGDIDGDGLNDVFFAGAAGQSGALFKASRDGRLDRLADGPWAHHGNREDQAPLFLDADSDGDQDLFVASGSYEFLPESEYQEDRLYLNDGRGNFTTAEGLLPEEQTFSGAAVAADFDRDGDLDLFIGSRTVPRAYPESAPSRLLVNENGKFSNRTGELAKGLEEAGLVTAAAWSDIDADGWIDLLLTTEWGPVRLYRNREGFLVEQTREAGLAERLGWWNSIEPADLDADGDMDFVVGNVGLNTKYGKPSAKKPTLLYYGDMEGTGRKRLVEAKKASDALLPVRGRSCSSNAMPSLRRKFPTYRAFASSTLQEIYTRSCLEDALRLEADAFHSGVLVNDGDGGFEFRPLPDEVQESPVYGIVAGEFTGDDHTDIYLVQNNFAREPETGLWRGGVSALLAGDGSGGFACVPPAGSGLVVDGDAKGLALVDLDGDAVSEFLVSQNNGEALAFTRAMGTRKGEPLKLSLRYKDGNPTAVGARVRMVSPTTSPVREVRSGSGYLSQSSPDLIFSLPSGAERATFLLRWPDGRVERHSVTLEGGKRAATLVPRLLIAR